MPQLKPIILFLGRFLLLYLVLVLPWPGWQRIYGEYFRALGHAVFASDSGQRELSFEPLADAQHPAVTRIVIVNRYMASEGGLVPVRNLDLDAMSVGWKPTALLLALIVATPISWHRRGWALLWGLLCVHAIILLFLGFSIWNESTEVSLVTLSPFWKQFAVGLNDLLIWLYSLIMPAVIWILVTFRREDRLGPIGLALFGPATNSKDDARENPAVKLQKQPQKRK